MPTAARSEQLTDEQRRLVEENIGLVGYAIRGCGAQGVEDMEDAFQTGALGLIRAATRYDSSRAGFATFALHCIRNELKQVWRIDRRKRRSGLTVISLDAQPGAGNGSNFHDALVDDNPSVEEQIEDADIAQRVFQMLDEQPDLAAAMTKAYLYDGLSQCAIADMFGYSQSQVCRLIQEKLDSLREQHEVEQHGNTRKRNRAGDAGR